MAPSTVTRRRAAATDRRVAVLRRACRAVSLVLATALVFAGCSAAPSGAPADDQVVAATEALFAGHNAAFEESPQAGWEYQVTHNYPGYANADDPAAAQLRERMLQAGYWEKFVPDLTSITADPDWIPAADGLSCLAAFTKPPAGQTFVVTVDRSGGETATNSLHPQQRTTVHVCLLDGTLYYFIPLCV
ncbi:MAG: hypothetical protein VB080_11580 [Propionicimonas sp.]|uniref:hypothetical protein n=1 Tax=Propionicimonas sp. TaxID=1955623 RepID=UPI002B20EF1A|nr:hypothetical protein [Propionicimonas sp.]MEA4945062.1 hypothetical protein [Propionicimonas sp.]MEA5055158.1 hypothetical protein [Propionicimonas sp.]MEA5118667.1 hypothetical protein [Propionicimonas sp.]